MCHFNRSQIILRLSFFQPNKNGKTILNLQAIQKQEGCRLQISDQGNEKLSYSASHHKESKTHTCFIDLVALIYPFSSPKPNLSAYSSMGPPISISLVSGPIILSPLHFVQISLIFKVASTSMESDGLWKEMGSNHPLWSSLMGPRISRTDSKFLTRTCKALLLSHLICPLLLVFDPVCYLILNVNLTGLQGAQTFGQTLFSVCA